MILSCSNMHSRKHRARRRCGLLGLFIASLLALISQPLYGHATFTPLGMFGQTRSFGRDVSSDGSVVVGTAYDATTGMYRLFRWTAQGTAPTTPFTYGDAAVSDDGNFIVATEPRFETFPNGVAIRWSVGGALDRLGELPNGTGSAAYDVSTNGTVVVGASGTFIGRTEAFRWTEASGMVPLGGLQGLPGISRAFGVSGDGTVIVGEATDMSNSTQAFRWTEQSGLVRLPLAANADGASANSVTPDGSTIVGTVAFPPPQPGFTTRSIEAFRWTEQQGMVPLGDLPGGRVFSIANDISSDGNVIVGRGETFYEDGVRVTNEAFYWNSTIGMVNLRDVLIAGGATGLDDWILTEANGVSYDGLTVVGTGIHNGVTEAWVATIPEPSTLLLAALAALVLCSRKWFGSRAVT